MTDPASGEGPESRPADDRGMMGTDSGPREDTVSSTKGPGRPRVLVTDDRPEMTEGILDALGGRYVCEFATNVEKAGEMVATDDYDVLLCDVQAGGEPAQVLAKEISSGELDTAVILITGKDDPEEADDAFELGAHGYVVKPPWPGQLLITVMNALRRRELEIASREHIENVEDRRQTIIDMAPMPIYAKDASGHYVVSNAKADELAGVEQGKLLGLTDEAIMTTDSMERSATIDRGVLDQGSVHEEEEMIEVGGVERVFKTVKFPLLDSDGHADAVGGISVDISAEREAGRLRDELAAAQEMAIEELQLSRMETIEGLAKAINLHDSPTAGHVSRMGAIAAFLAAELGLDKHRVELIRAAAPMHDVGKIGTPADLLNKPGPLTEDELGEMMRHTIVGHELFEHFTSELSKVAATIALTHHERYDGSGYPHGLVGEEIPLEGRIAAVADVFDALLSERSYRAAMSVEEAVAVIREGMGTHFDPRIADVLLENVDAVIAVRDDPDPTGRRSRPKPTRISARERRPDASTGPPPEGDDGIAEVDGGKVLIAETSSTGANSGHRGLDRAAEAISRSFGDALRAADSAAAERIAFEALHEGVSVATLYQRVIGPAMWRIGCLWEEGAITVADEHLATALAHRVMAGVFGSNFGHASSRPGRILLAAVEGQHHALGLRMAADVLELAGYEVIYLGGDVPVDALIAATDSRRPDLVGLSYTVSPEKSLIGRTVSRLQATGPDLPILVGGQGVPEGILGEDRVIPASTLEGLVELVQALLADRRDGSNGEEPGRSTPPALPPLVDAGGDSPEDRLLAAATDSANLARTHARMAHSYRQLAYADPITKGPNRRAFDDRLALLNDSPEAAPVAVLMLDLDGFKQANDTLGHAAGDVVLREVFGAIESCLREADFAARLGGDEFGLLLPKTRSADAGEIAERVLVAVREAGREASVTATIGIAPLAGDPRHAMLEVDLALYEGKTAGGDRTRVRSQAGTRREGAAAGQSVAFDREG